MSKKKARQPKKPKLSQRESLSRRKAVVVIGLILCLGLTTLILAQWHIIHTSSNPLSPVPQASPTPQLSKEYIYAGGKLIATEEPNNGGGNSPLSAPSGLIAAGNSIPNAQVTLTWLPSTGGTINHYRVERCQNFGQNCYTWVADVPDASPTVSYTDNGVSAGVAYLYRVRGVDSQGNFTNYSNIDLATAITFLNNPLVSYAENQSNATPVRAAHITELRSAVNAVRSLAGLSAASWTNAVQSGAVINHLDLTELRSSLEPALTALGLPIPSYQYPTIMAQVSLIHKADIQELRDAVK
jgi:hypothetical protein